MNKLVISAGFLLVLIVGLWTFSGDDNNQIPSDTSPRQADDEAVRIIAFGDSLTAGYGVSQSEAYPAQLEKALQAKGYDVAVINSGVSGETTRGNLERAPFIRSQNPDVVLLGIGGNDALRALPLAATEQNIRQTIAILQDEETPPVILLLKMQSPLNAGRDYKRRFDSIYEEIATDKGLVLVPFITAELFLEADNKLADGIHYNQVGYSKIVEHYVLPALEEILNRDRG